VRTFAAKVAEIEKESASKLLALTKQFEPTLNVHPHSPMFAQCWKDLVGMVGDAANARDVASVSIMNEVCQPLRTLIKEKTQERSELLKQVAQLQNDLQKHAATFEKCKKAYDKVEKDAVAAKVAYEKIEMSEVDKKKKIDQARREYAAKAQAREDAERQLCEDLDTFNRERTVIYYSHMPAVFDSLQAMDENRAEGVVNQINQTVACLRQAAQSELRAIDGVEGSCRNFDKGSDAASFAAAVKTGQPQPGDIPFDEVMANRPSAKKNSPRVQRKLDKRPSMVDGDAYEPSTPMAASTPAAAPATPAAPAAPAPPRIQIMYDFAGSNQGELPVVAGEVVFLMQDDGSGWALAAKSDGSQGYVPSTYYQVLA